MTESRQRTPHAATVQTIAEIHDWYRSQSTAAVGARSARIEEVNVGEIWMEFDLTETKLEGYLLEPFVQDLGRGQWIQGWSDGWTLSVAVPCGSAAFALGFVRAIG